MVAPAESPALGQKLVVFQGATKPVKFVIPDPDGVLVGAPGVWWAGVVAWAGGPPSADGSGCVRGAPGSRSRPGLTGASDGAGNTVFAFAIAAADLADLAPRAGYQHELWVTEPGQGAYPVSIGPLTIFPTIGGGAA